MSQGALSPQGRSVDDRNKGKEGEEGIEMQPGLAQIGVSQLSIPLAWNREQHFKSKGECRTFTMFVTLRCGEELIDSKLVTTVDRTVTDVVFREEFIFAKQSDDFCLEIDVLAARTDDFEGSGGSLRQKITRSLGRKLGQATKQKLTVGEEALKAALPTAPECIGSTQYNLLARAQLALSDAGEEPKVHDLKSRAFADLCGPPLYGSLICRLAVQPLSVLHPIADGVLTVVPADQQRVYQLVRATLQSGRLLCFVSSSVSPTRDDEQVLLDIMLNAGSRVARTSRQDELILTTAASVYGPAKRYYIKTATESLEGWGNAFARQIADCVAWGAFAYSSHPLTKETTREPETIGRSAGKRFYDQIDINGTLPRQFGTTSPYLMQLASSSFSRRPPPASVLSLNSNNNTAPARRTMIRPSVMNVFSDIAESPSEFIHSTPIPPPPSRSLGHAPVHSSNGSTPTPRPYERRNTERSYATTSTLHSPVRESIYGTDARRYAPAIERKENESRARLYEQKSQNTVYHGRVHQSIGEESPYVIRLTVGDECELSPAHSPRETINDYAPRPRVGKELPVIRNYRNGTPIGVPRTNFALRPSASERDARYPSHHLLQPSYASHLAAPIQITRL